MSGPRSVTARFSDCGCPILCLIYEYLPPLAFTVFRPSPLQKTILAAPGVSGTTKPFLALPLVLVLVAFASEGGDAEGEAEEDLLTAGP